MDEDVIESSTLDRKGKEDVRLKWHTGTNNYVIYKIFMTTTEHKWIYIISFLQILDYCSL